SAPPPPGRGALARRSSRALPPAGRFPLVGPSCGMLPSCTMRPDAELLSAWRGGDEKAGAELFERHFEALFRFFRNKAGDQAEDLVQETFLACLSGPAFRGEASFRTYLFTVAR